MIEVFWGVLLQQFLFLFLLHIMSILDLDKNAAFGENGTGKLYIATNYTGLIYEDGNGTNEDEAITALAALTYSDVWYFEKFAISLKKWDEKVILTDYCSVGEISRKKETVPWFKVDVQEILEMNNLAQILGTVVNVSQVWKEIIGMKRIMKSNPYQVFKFVTCPKGGKSNTFFFVKAALSGDVEIPFTNLNRDDFVGVTLEFEVAEGGNFYAQKEV